MVNKKYKKLEEDIDKQFKETLEGMTKEETEEYFKQLIEKFYSVIYNYEPNYNKYVKDLTKQYDVITKVKDLIKYKYPNLEYYENFVRMQFSEDLAYKQMMELHFLEGRYSNIIYYNAVQELNFINNTLSVLIQSYKDKPSEELLNVLQSVINVDSATIIKDVEKLPTSENLEEIKVDVVYNKNYIKGLSEEEKEELPETIKTYDYEKSVFSIVLKDQLEKFYSLLKEAENILPERSLTNFYETLNSSDLINFLNYMLENKPEDVTEEDVYKQIAFIKSLDKKEGRTYLYEIIDSWS